jgi:uracil-DNA glycosylase
MVFPPRSDAPFDRGEWDALTQQISTCKRCALHRTRTQVVVFRGAFDARVVFVGEAPGKREDLEGLPFVGAAGKRLDAAIAGLGLRPGDVGILNVIKCRPPANRFDRAAAATCRPFLLRQLALLRPVLLVTLGANALAAIDPGAPPVTQAAGTVREDGPTPVFPLLHPAAMLHNPRLRGRWTRDLRRLRAFVRSRWTEPL